MEKKKKLSLMMAISLAVGAIIGSGIFVFTGYAIGLCGSGVPLAFILAALLTVFMTLPSIQMGSAIPATGGSYMYVSRFVHPFVGYIQILNTLIGSLNIAVMSLAFSAYFIKVFPSTDMYIVAAITAFLFAIIGTFGVRISGWVQQAIVVVLLLALAIYIFGGFGHIDPANVTPAKVFEPLGGWAGLWAAIAIVRYTLQGGTIVLALGNEIENPGKNIPLAFFIGTLVTAVIYALVGYVTVGVAPYDVIANKPLADSAALFLQGPILTFFLVGGGMLATLTTLNGSFLIYSNIHWAAARDGIWPKFFANRNKHNVPARTLWAVTLSALVVILFKIELGRIFYVVAVPGLLLSAFYYLPPILLPYKLPNCHKKAWFRMNKSVTLVVSVLSVIASMSLGWSLFKRMQPGDYISMAIFFAIGFVYWFVRVSYLKKKDVDLVGSMKGYHPLWIAKENEETVQAETS